MKILFAEFLGIVAVAVSFLSELHHQNYDCRIGKHSQCSQRVESNKRNVSKLDVAVAENRAETNYTLAIVSRFVENLKRPLIQMRYSFRRLHDTVFLSCLKTFRVIRSVFCFKWNSLSSISPLKPIVNRTTVSDNPTNNNNNIDKRFDFLGCDQFVASTFFHFDCRLNISQKDETHNISNHYGSMPQSSNGNSCSSMSECKTAVTNHDRGRFVYKIEETLTREGVSERHFSSHFQNSERYRIQFLAVVAAAQVIDWTKYLGALLGSSTEYLTQLTDEKVAFIMRTDRHAGHANGPNSITTAGASVERYEPIKDADLAIKRMRRETATAVQVLFSYLSDMASGHVDAICSWASHPSHLHTDSNRSQAVFKPITIAISENGMVNASGFWLFQNASISSNRNNDSYPSGETVGYSIGETIGDSIDDSIDESIGGSIGDDLTSVSISGSISISDSDSISDRIRIGEPISDLYPLEYMPALRQGEETLETLANRWINRTRVAATRLQQSRREESNQRGGGGGGGGGGERGRLHVSGDAVAIAYCRSLLFTVVVAMAALALPAALLLILCGCIRRFWRISESRGSRPVNNVDSGSHSTGPLGGPLGPIATPLDFSWLDVYDSAASVDWKGEESGTAATPTLGLALPYSTETAGHVGRIRRPPKLLATPAALRSPSVSSCSWPPSRLRSCATHKPPLARTAAANTASAATSGAHALGAGAATVASEGLFEDAGALTGQNPGSTVETDNAYDSNCDFKRPDFMTTAYDGDTSVYPLEESSNATGFGVTSTSTGRCTLRTTADLDKVGTKTAAGAAVLLSALASNPVGPCGVVMRSRGPRAPTQLKQGRWPRHPQSDTHRAQYTSTSSGDLVGGLSDGLARQRERVTETVGVEEAEGSSISSSSSRIVIPATPSPPRPPPSPSRIIVAPRWCSRDSKLNVSVNLNASPKLESRLRPSSESESAQGSALPAMSEGSCMRTIGCNSRVLITGGRSTTPETALPPPRVTFYHTPADDVNGRSFLGPPLVIESATEDRGAQGPPPWLTPEAVPVSSLTPHSQLAVREMVLAVAVRNEAHRDSSNVYAISNRQSSCSGEVRGNYPILDSGQGSGGCSDSSDSSESVAGALSAAMTSGGHYNMGSQQQQQQQRSESGLSGISIRRSVNRSESDDPVVTQTLADHEMRMPSNVLRDEDGGHEHDRRCGRSAPRGSSSDSMRFVSASTSDEIDDDVISARSKKLTDREHAFDSDSDSSSGSSDSNSGTSLIQTDPKATEVRLNRDIIDKEAAPPESFTSNRNLSSGPSGPTRCHSDPSCESKGAEDKTEASNLQFVDAKDMRVAGAVQEKGALSHSPALAAIAVVGRAAADTAATGGESERRSRAQTPLCPFFSPTRSPMRSRNHVDQKSIRASGTLIPMPPPLLLPPLLLPVPPLLQTGTAGTAGISAAPEPGHLSGRTAATPIPSQHSPRRHCIDTDEDSAPDSSRSSATAVAISSYCLSEASQSCQSEMLTIDAAAAREGPRQAPPGQPRAMLSEPPGQPRAMISEPLAASGTRLAPSYMWESGVNTRTHGSHSVGPSTVVAEWGGDHEGHSEGESTAVAGRSPGRGQGCGQGWGQGSSFRGPRDSAPLSGSNLCSEFDAASPPLGDLASSVIAAEDDDDLGLLAGTCWGEQGSSEHSKQSMARAFNSRRNRVDAARTAGVFMGSPARSRAIEEAQSRPERDFSYDSLGVQHIVGRGNSSSNQGHLQHSEGFLDYGAVVATEMKSGTTAAHLAVQHHPSYPDPNPNQYNAASALLETLSAEVAACLHQEAEEAAVDEASDYRARLQQSEALCERLLAELEAVPMLVLSRERQREAVAAECNRRGARLLSLSDQLLKAQKQLQQQHQKEARVGSERELSLSVSLCAQLESERRAREAAESRYEEAKQNLEKALKERGAERDAASRHEVGCQTDKLVDCVDIHDDRDVDSTWRERRQGDLTRGNGASQLTVAYLERMLIEAKAEVAAMAAQHDSTLAQLAGLQGVAESRCQLLAGSLRAEAESWSARAEELREETLTQAQGFSSALTKLKEQLAAAEADKEALAGQLARLLAEKSVVDSSHQALEQELSRALREKVAAEADKQTLGYQLALTVDEKEALVTASQAVEGRLSRVTVEKQALGEELSRELDTKQALGLQLSRISEAKAVLEGALLLQGSKVKEEPESGRAALQAELSLALEEREASEGQRVAMSEQLSRAIKEKESLVMQLSAALEQTEVAQNDKQALNEKLSHVMEEQQAAEKRHDRIRRELMREMDALMDTVIASLEGPRGTISAAVSVTTSAPGEGAMGK